jgi:hypothetical protein
LVATALLLSALAAPRVAWASLKLVMKDGTYQIVSSYEVQGGRVRYFSVERAEWEEVPAELVDLPATKRAEEEAKSTAKKQLEEAKELDHERFYKPPNEGMEIAPGIRLPGDDGIFTLEGPRLMRLVQSNGELVTDKKRAALLLAMPLPVMKTRSLAVLPGVKAAIRLNNPLPVFYVQSGDALGARLELVRLKVGKEARVVEEVEASRGKTGKVSEERTQVPLERKQMAPNVYALKPLQPLDAGEYVLGELLGEKLNLDVWDFGYDKWEVVK